MRYVPAQCKVCPFRKASLSGWLGEYAARDVFESIWRGVPFFCHSSINYEDPNWMKKAMESPKHGKLCVGGLVYANKILAPQSFPPRDGYQHYPIIIAGRKEVKLRTDVECMEPKEFLDHHPDRPGVGRNIKREW